MIAAAERTRRPAEDRTRSWRTRSSRRRGGSSERADQEPRLGVEDFATLTKLVVDASGITASGRIVSLLEGGYHVDRLAESVEVHLKTLVAS